MRGFVTFPSGRGLLAALCAIAGASPAIADESGMSFWLPGQFGSFAAVPVTPGLSMPVAYYHTSVDAGAAKQFIAGGQLVAGMDASADLAFFIPTYTFREPVAGGQASLGMAWAAGRMRVTADATATGPGGGQVGRSRTDQVTGGSDLYPLGTLKWQDGVNNWMVYTMAGVPVGAYRKGRLANIGVNHWSIDAGGGYTYLDPKKGHELSAVAGLTYNFENEDTDYQNGIDGHVDWAASQFLNEQLHVGVVGYFFYQLTGDSGSGAVLGDFKSRVNAIGPQVGYFFAVGREKGYFNLKGFWEFDAKNRPEGWNLWLTAAIPLSAFGVGR
ncbi:MAG: transporter [Burkholderiales bacterium]|nr:transporter [Burkholderiales bacterium]